MTDAQALQDLRRSLAYVAALTDSVLMGAPTDAAQASDKLPHALRMLGRRVQQAIDAMEGHP